MSSPNCDADMWHVRMKWYMYKSLGDSKYYFVNRVCVVFEHHFYIYPTSQAKWLVGNVVTRVGI